MGLEEDYKKILDEGYDAAKKYTDEKVSEIETDLKQYTDEAIIADNLAEQVWIPNVNTKDDLDSLSVTDQETAWLVLVKDENAIYRRLPDYEEEADDGYINGFDVYFELVGTDVNAIESLIEEQIGNHNEEVNAHADIRALIDNLDLEVVKIEGSQNVNGVKTFTVSPKVPSPTASTDVANKGYVDQEIGNAITGGDLGNILDGIEGNVKQYTDEEIIAHNLRTDAHEAAFAEYELRVSGAIDDAVTEFKIENNL